MFSSVSNYNGEGEYLVFLKQLAHELCVFQALYSISAVYVKSMDYKLILFKSWNGMNGKKFSIDVMTF